MVKWGRFVFLSGFPLFIFSGVLKTSPTVAGNRQGWRTTGARRPGRPHARPLGILARFVIGRHSGGEACQITNGNLGHALTAVMTVLACTRLCRAPRRAAGWYAVHCVCRLVCSRENRETYNCTTLLCCMYVCLRDRHQRANKPALLQALSCYDTQRLERSQKFCAINCQRCARTHVTPLTIIGMTFTRNRNDHL